MTAVNLNGLATDAAGNVYATGGFQGTIDLDPGAGTVSQTSAGGYDIYALKLDAAGNYAWGTAFGSTGNDIGYGVAVDTAGTVYLAGRFSRTVDFDPDPIGTNYLTGSGLSANGYLVKLKPS